MDDDAAEVAVAMYEMAFEQVVRVKSARVAEATKLTENIFRSVNVALVNELKTVFGRMSIDAILIATDHSGVDYELIASNARLIVDSRGVYRDPRDNVVKA